MRIIGGIYKNKKISLPTDKFTRPLKDMVRESIFNIIEHSNLIKKKILDSKVLDLYSGSGSFGIECLSRGSKIVYFFENYFEAIKILEKNLSLLKNEKNFQIFKSDCFEFFNSYQKINEKFDIIFLDPPFKEKKINELIEKIIENKILNAGGIIIIHRHKKDKIEITDKIKIFDVRNYGLSKVYFAN